MKYILVCALLFLPFFSYADDKSDATNSGKTIGKSLSDTYSSQSNIKTKLYNPLVGEGVKMNTLQESWKCQDKDTAYETQSECAAACSQSCVIYSFDAKLQCTSSTEAVTVQPYTFPAGGEVSLKITYDTDLDGTADTSFTTSNISGFCTNGYVSCTPGTFQNCKYYEFGIKHKCNGGTEYNTYRECDAACSGVCKPSDNKTLAFQRSVTEMRHAGGCFCSNASCGSSFNGVFHNALSYFGGALTGHMMSELGLALTNTDVDVSTLSVKYYAASAASCTDLSDDTVDELKSFYQTGNIDYDDKLTEQMADSDSMYNTMISQTNKTASVHECSITNTPIVETGSTAEYWCTPSGVTTKIVQRTGYSDRQFTEHYQCIDEDGDGRGEKVRFKLDCELQGESYFRCDYDSSNGWQSVILNNYSGGDQSSGATVKVSWGSDGGTVSALLYYSISCSESVCQLSHYADVGKYGTANNSYTSMMLTMTRNETVHISRNNSCAALAQDSDCRLESEIVNDTDTIVNYTQMNISPQSVCKTVSATYNQFMLCDSGNSFQAISSNSTEIVSSKNDGLEWFSIKRTYVCQDGTSYDFSGAKAQADMVGGTLDKDSGDFSYITEDGVASGNVKLDFDSYETCSYTCTVQTGNQDTTVFPDQETRSDTSAVVQEQRPCGTDYSTGARTCPYDSASETLLSGCACTNSFNEVISLFSSITDAVKDMICSSTEQ
ncbi:MAG: hypothetical protein AB7F25_02855 [Deferribacterales bacterium]